MQAIHFVIVERRIEGNLLVGRKALRPRRARRQGLHRGSRKPTVGLLPERLRERPAAHQHQVAAGTNELQQTLLGNDGKVRAIDQREAIELAAVEGLGTGQLLGRNRRHRDARRCQRPGDLLQALRIQGSDVVLENGHAIRPLLVRRDGWPCIDGPNQCQRSQPHHDREKAKNVSHPQAP